MSEVYKHFKSGEKKITNAVTHKHWKLNQATTSSLGIVEFTARPKDSFANENFNSPTSPSSTEFALGDPNQGFFNNENLQTVGNYNYYSWLVYKSIVNLYYDRENTIYDRFCNDNPKKSFRHLGINNSVISIPSTLYGERIKPGSVYISSSDRIYVDDQYGNLQDLTDTSGSAVVHFIQSSSIYLSFEDATHKYLEYDDIVSSTAPALKTSSLSAEKYGKREAIAYYVNYKNGLSSIDNTYAVFHGSQSLQESHSIEVPHDNSFIEILDTKGMSLELNDDTPNWAISMHVNCPISQSVTQSFTGNFSGNNSVITRAANDRPLNVIATSREWTGGDCPFEISVYNSSTVKDGKVNFFAKSKSDNKSLSLDSTATINDGNWHHIFIYGDYQSGAAAITMWIDGTVQGAVPGADFAPKAPVNIHLGARPYHFKKKYYNQRTQKFTNLKTNKNYIDPFSGSIDNFFITPNVLEIMGTDAKNISASFGHNYVGNVMYDHGLIIKSGGSNKYSGKYINAAATLGDTEFRFRATHKIKEHLYVCNILDGEFNATYNPTARVGRDPRNQHLESYTTHSEFNPYITSIGLYDDYNNLVAIGKLAQPIKNQDDYDNSFVVKFDTTI